MEMNPIYAEYIDVNDALSRVGGNMTLYKRLLGRFVDGNLYDELVKTLQNGDIEESARQAHSIKGVSANLSLVKIHALSIELEKMVKESADYSSCMAELKQVFDITLEGIAQLLSE